MRSKQIYYTKLVFQGFQNIVKYKIISFSFFLLSFVNKNKVMWPRIQQRKMKILCWLVNRSYLKLAPILTIDLLFCVITRCTHSAGNRKCVYGSPKYLCQCRCQALPCHVLKYQYKKYRNTNIRDFWPCQTFNMASCQMLIKWFKSFTD